MEFNPVYFVSAKTARNLMRIEAVCQKFIHLPLTVSMQHRLRETARLLSTHYSTEIEGNRLTLEQAREVVQEESHFPGRERDEQEVLGYYQALDAVEEFSSRQTPVSEQLIKRLHALVMGKGRKTPKPSEYREGQNVIRESGSRRIVYMPPEAKDVAVLMAQLVEWVNSSMRRDFPVPLIAGIAHYQFATIHPYYDGNGRTARLLTTCIMHLGGYDLKGFYSLEEYYAKNLSRYYAALSMGPSHNYYMGRAEADITPWIDYFCEGAAEAFEAVCKQAEQETDAGKSDTSTILRSLDARQRKALTLFAQSDWMVSADVARLFGVQPRTARELCRKWCENGFLEPLTTARKNRRYGLTEKFKNGVLEDRA